MFLKPQGGQPRRSWCVEKRKGKEKRNKRTPGTTITKLFWNS
jgi:hypothetical protein